MTTMMANNDNCISQFQIAKRKFFFHEKKCRAFSQCRDNIPELVNDDANAEIRNAYASIKRRGRHNWNTFFSLCRFSRVTNTYSSAKKSNKNFTLWF